MPLSFGKVPQMAIGVFPSPFLLSTNMSTFQYPSSAPIKHSGIVAGEVIGWRSWRLKDDGLLYSMTNETKWEPGQPVSGKTDEYLGVHSWCYEQSLKSYVDESWFVPLALGTIAMWGEVVEHELGYRAEYARVSAIKAVIHVFHLPMHRLHFLDAELAKLHARYGVGYPEPRPVFDSKGWTG